MLGSFFARKIPLTDQQKNEIIQGLKLKVIAAAPVKAIVFGSFADGTANTNSDIDILMVCKNDIHLKQVRTKIYSNLQGALSTVAVDLIFVTSDEFDRKRLIGGVCMIADQSGIVLYQETT